MSDFAKMDIFFVVATVATALVALLIAFMLFYIVRILRNVEHISDIASEEAQLVREDVDELRAHVRREGFKIMPFSDFISKFIQRFFRKKSTK